MNEQQLAQDLLDFIHESPSPFHVVSNSVKLLESSGFVELKMSESWCLEKGGKYYVTINDSALIAFIVGTNTIESDGFRIIQTHTDSPSIRIKPFPEMAGGGNVVKLNAEVYGSPILSTWLDRPLSLAGRVSLRGTSTLYPKQVPISFDEPMLYIPNISIHHNKGVNSGVELNPQKDMLPLFGMTDGKDTSPKLLVTIAKQIGCDPSDIRDFELYTSEFERGCVWGPQKEFISSKKLDNLGLVYASLKALTSVSTPGCTPLICCVDSEEVGNRTIQGADSPMLADVLERICISLGKSREEYLRSKQASFMVSADMSHAIHPNAPERSDPVVKVAINGGPVIKVSGAQKFTTTSETSTVFQEVCNLAHVPWQFYVNKSDSPGGSAAGTASVTHVDVRSVDMGLALYAMHSIREMGGVSDNAYAHMVFSSFLQLND